MSDEPGAIWIPVPAANVFLGYEGHTPKWICLHKTASGGTAQDIAHFFQTVPDKRSSHYVIGQDGTIVQCVSEADGAGANCCLETGHAAFLPTNINLNLLTLSIEHVDPTADNSTPLTPAQKAASFKLVQHICERYNIPKRAGDANGGIIGHYQIAPINRARCPGNYPWSELFAYLGMVKLNAHGEVADFQDASQFEPHESEFACGEFATAIVKFAGEPDKGPTGTAEQIDQMADAFYTKYIGPNVTTNTQGTTIEVMHQMLIDCGLPYNDLTAIKPNSQQASDIALIKAALALGYPLLATITEASVIDLDLGRNPYSWGPSGTHIVVYSGIAHDGNLLVRDPANIIGPLQVNNTVQPGPRRYDIQKIATQWATMVKLPWLPPIPAIGGNMYIKQSAKDCWESTAGLFGGTSPSYTSGIALAWQQLYSKGKKPGPPITLEYGGVNWSGKAIRVQEFSNTRCEWDGQDHWYPQL